MPQNLTRVSQILPPGDQSKARTDAWIQAQCPVCSAMQRLSEAHVQHVGSKTVYTCKAGCCTLVIVGDPEARAWPGRGFRLGDYLLRNAVDLLIDVANTANKVKIPASPAALEAN
jgi:hypothetical protein